MTTPLHSSESVLLQLNSLSQEGLPLGTPVAGTDTLQTSPGSDATLARWLEALEQRSAFPDIPPVDALVGGGGRYGKTMPLGTEIDHPLPLDATQFAGDQSGTLDGLLVGSRESDTSDELLHQSLATRELVFIDAGLPDVEQLVAAVRLDQEVVLLDPSQDGIGQIQTALAGRRELTAVHIVAHGGAGRLNLGSTVLDQSNLSAHATALQEWGKALGNEADLMIYGCDVAFGTAGTAFVQQLADLTGADVAASEDLTGYEALGGDWVLEFETGQIETEIAFGQGLRGQYAYTFADLTADQINAFRNGFNDIQSFGDSLTDFEELDAILPFLGDTAATQQTLGDLLEIGDSLANLAAQVNSYLTDPNVATKTTAGLAAKLEELAGPTPTNLVFSQLDVTDIADTSEELLLQLDLTATRTTSLPINFNGASEDLGLTLENTAFDVTGELNFDFIFGVEIATGEFFLRDASLEAEASLDGTLNADLKLGFLDAQINGGSVNLDASLNAAFTDSNSDNRLQISELNTNNLSFTPTTSSFDITLPVTADPGIQGLPAGTLTLALSDSDVFDGDAPQLDVTSDVAGLIDFNNLSPEEMQGMLQQLGNWLTEIGSSDLLNQQIPLTDLTVGDAIDFGKAFRDEVLNKILNIQQDPQTGLITSITPKFSSAQELAQELGNAIGATVTANYDPGSKELTFAIAFSDSISATHDVNFGAELGDIASISTSSELALTADANLGFTFGINLEPSEGLQVAPPLFQPSESQRLSQTGFQLSGTANFTVELFEQQGDNPVSLGVLNVTVPAVAGAGRTAETLQVEIEDAVEDQLTALGLPTDDISVDVAGDRFFLVARQFAEVPGEPLQAVDRWLQIDTDFNDPAYQQLGLLGGPTPFDGQLNADAVFELTYIQNDVETSTTVTVTSAATAANNNIGELIEDINAAMAAAGVPSAIQAQQAIENARGNRIVFGVAEGQNISRLELLATDANPTNPSNAAITQLGFIVDETVTAKGRATEFFLDNAALTGNLSLAANDLEASANLGFLGVSLDNSSGSITGGASLALKEPTSGNSRVTLEALVDAFDVDSTLSVTDKLAEYTKVVDATIDGNVNVDLTVTPEVGISLAPIQLELDLDIPDWLSENLPNLNVNLVGSAKDAFESFKNISFSQVIDGLQEVVDYIDGLDSLSGVSDVIDAPLPLLNQSISDLLSFGSKLADFIEQVESNPSQSVQVLNAWFKESLGLPAESSLVNLSLDSSGTAPALRLDLRFEAGVSDSYGLDLDLQDLGVGSNLSNLVGVSSTGNLSAEFEGVLNLALGFDLGNNATPFLYVGDSGTKLSLAAAATGEDLNFTAQVGPLGLFVVDGGASLNGGFSIDLADDGDGRRSFSEAASSGVVQVGVTGSANTTLPLFFPSESSPLGGEGNNNLAIDIPDLLALFQNGSDAVNVTTPDLSGLGSAIANPLELLANPEFVVDGLDQLLLILQDALDSEVLAQSLPFIGDELQSSARFIEDFRVDVLSYISTNLRGFNDAIDSVDDLVQETLFNIFASESQGAEKLFGSFGALGLLKDSNGDGQITLDDIQITDENGNSFEIGDRGIQFDFLLGQQLLSTSSTVDFDLALPALGLDIDAGVQLDVGWDFDFGFGINLDDGFYFATDGEDELKLYAEANLVGSNGDKASASGQLGFLALTAEEKADDDVKLDLEFAIDIKDPGNGDDRLTFSEMISSSTGLSDMIEAKANGGANLELRLELGGDFDGDGQSDKVLPTVFTDLVMEWDFLNASTSSGVEFGSAPTFEFKDVTLDFGSFISDFAGPFLEDIGDILEPLDWLIDRNDGLLYKRLPVISDLAGETINIKRLIELYDRNAKITPFLNAVEEVYFLIDLVTDAAAEAEGGNILLNFGDLSSLDLGLGDLRNSTNEALQQIQIPSNLGSTPQTPTTGQAGKFSSKLTSGEGSVAFPILEATSIFQLLMGQDVDLVTYDLPEFGFEFNYRQKFPVFPPLFATLGGFFSAGIDLSIGYDTLGLSQFRDTGNFLDVVNGFFISDVDKNGVDIPELQLRGGITAGAEINLGIASAGAEGGIEFIADFNLNDPDRDTKVRLSEMADNIVLNNNNPLAIFDISARMEWFFRAYFELDLLFTSISKEIDLGRGTLVDFGETNFTRTPFLAEQRKDTLFLNIGPNAHNRINGNIQDGNESITVRESGGQFLVSGFGITDQEYSASGITKIVAIGGEGNDVIDLSGVTSVETEIQGGAGNDILKGGGQGDLIVGGEGNDQIEGNGGDDRLIGEEGEDSLSGGAGNDLLDGGSGNDDLSGGADNDTLIGGEGNEANLDGGSGDDTYLFSNSWGVDTVVDTSGNDTWNFNYRDQVLGQRINAVTTTDVTFLLKDNQLQASSLENTVTKANLGIETLKGGRGGDLYSIFQSGIAGDNGEILLDGQEGSDTYEVNFTAPGATPLPLNVALKDNGPIWNVDRAIAFGSDNADDITVTNELVRANFTGGTTQEFKYNKFAPDSGIETLEVQAKAGDDQVTLESTPDSMTVEVGGEDGDDTFIVGGPAGNATLNNIDGNPDLGPIVLDGDAGNDRLLIDDSGDSSNNTGSTAGVLTDKRITGLGMTVGLEHKAMERIDVELGSANDELTIVSTIPGITTVNANAGNDVITVDSANYDLAKGAVLINGNDGDDQLLAGSTTSAVLLGGGSGSDRMVGGSGNDRLRGDSDFAIASDVFDVSPLGSITFAQQASPGRDQIEGRGGQDTIFGEGDDDSLVGGSTQANLPDAGDFIFGGAGNDAIAGDNATINTTSGAVTPLADNQGAADYILGDQGSLTIQTASTTTQLDSSAATGTVAPLNGTVTQATSVADVVADGEDSINGSVGNDAILGGGGEDVIRGASGDDILLGDHGQISFDSSQQVTQVKTTEASTGGNDDLAGDEGDDRILGGAGNDTISGAAGSDILLGDNGQLDFNLDNDPTTLDLAQTTDSTIGGSDNLSGGDDNDILLGGAQADQIRGDAGDDILLGDNGDINAVLDGNSNSIDRIRTQAPDVGGQDNITGGLGEDVVLGGADADSIQGNAGADILLGDNGQVLYSNGQRSQVASTDPTEGGNDTIQGNNGDDIAIGGTGSDQVDGATGDDILLGDSGQVLYNSAGQLSEVSSIAPAVGGNDVLEGQEGDDIVLGGAANDDIVGATGNDILLGDNGQVLYSNGQRSQIASTDPTEGGDDTIQGNEGDDIAIGGTGSDQVDGAAGDDILLGDSGQVIYSAGQLSEVSSIAPAVGGNDVLEGQEGDDIVLGGAANDDIVGATGNDILLGDNGQVLYSNGQRSQIASTDPTEGGDDRIQSNEGDDIAIGGTGSDQVDGATGDDILLGDSGQVLYNSTGQLSEVSSIAPAVGGNDVLEGKEGDDIVLGGAANDDITGASGDDILLGDNGQVTYSNGQRSQVAAIAPAEGGDDTIQGDEGDDIEIGGAGSDQVRGAQGNDILLGDSGQVVYNSSGQLSEVSSLAPELGGDDVLEGNEGNDIAMGGAADDDLSGDAGNDMLVGDSGKLSYSAGQLSQIETIAPNLGGTDQLTGGDGQDVGIGGAANDQIFGQAGRDILLGDNGQLSYNNGLLTQIQTTAPNIGGQDQISGGDERDIAIGGAAEDNISGGSNDDILFGDNAQLEVTATTATSYAVRQAQTLNPEVGGADHIQGGTGKDVILGGAAGDRLEGNDGDDVALGDHGRVDYAYAGDTFQAGDADLSTLDFVTTTDPTLGGNDTILGGAGKDQVLGGTGGDVIRGDQDAVFDIAEAGWQRVGQGDFNGDGSDDFVWHNQLDGRTGIWLMDEGTVGVATLLNQVPTNWQVDQVADFDGDGKADLLWRERNTGSIVLWQMDGATITTGSAVGGAPGVTWNIEQAVDFNGDGKADLLWREQTLGTIVIWQMDGSTVANGTILSNNPGLNWQIEQAIELNGDGKADLLWREQTTGAVALWQMDGLTIAGGAAIANSPGLNWQIEQATDFNGDLKTDLLWREQTGGTIAIWQLDGPSVANAALFANSPSRNWSIEAAADFTGDRKSDILWREQNSGDIFLWQMDGLNVTSGSAVGNLLSNWQVDALGDFDGNGQADLLWQEQGSGTLATWLFEQGQLVAGHGLYIPGAAIAASDDTLLGDHGKIYSTLLPDRNYVAIDIGSNDGGGNDYIFGNQGDDIILGQQGDDYLEGNSGEDDIIGGHNVIGGADGDDRISGGAQADVVLGDNGTILRRPVNAATVSEDRNWQRYAAPFEDVIRDVRRFDDIDQVGGADIIQGDEGDDILHGQRGDDRIDGGAGDDEILGELGNDVLEGGSGNDSILGDVGIIQRVLNSDGSPQLDANGSWHRDVLLTDVGRLLSSQAISSVDSNSLKSTDLLLLSGQYDSNGNAIGNSGQAVNSSAQRVDLLDDGDDQIAGGDGSDRIWGQRGNDQIAGDAGDDYIEGNAGADNISGGSGNDMLIGDEGATLTPWQTELPKVSRGIHLINAEAGVPVTLNPFGNIVLPSIQLDANPLQGLLPTLTLMPQVQVQSAAQAPIGGIPTLDGSTTYQPLIQIIPDLANHQALLAGADVIRGDAGEDTLVGDNFTSAMPLRTGDSNLDLLIENLLLEMGQVTFDLHDLEVLSTAQGAPVLELGQDDLDGGLDDDFIVGDNAVNLSPFEVAQPLDGLETGQIVNLRSLLSQFDQQLNQQISLFNPANAASLTLRQGNDNIQGSTGNDSIIGDDSLMLAPVLDSLPYVPRSFWDYGFSQLRRSGSRSLRDWNIVWGEDNLGGGAGQDLMIGDYGTLLTPIVTAPVTDQNQLEDSLETLVNDLNVFVRDAYQHDFGLSQDQRSQTINAGSDRLNGEDGNDLMLGDTATITLPWINGVVDLSIPPAENSHLNANNEAQNFFQALPHQFYESPRTVAFNPSFGLDVMTGGNGNDIIFGQGNIDSITGNGGDDYIFGGEEADVIDGGTGSNIERKTNPSPGDWLNIRPQVDAQLLALLSPTWQLALTEVSLATTTGNDRLKGRLVGALN